MSSLDDWSTRKRYTAMKGLQNLLILLNMPLQVIKNLLVRDNMLSSDNRNKRSQIF